MFEEFAFQAESKPTRDIAISLSGGGTRAAAFAIGVMDVLIEQGMLSRLASIASTSGGGLVNAAVAKGLLLAGTDPDIEQSVRAELDKLAERLRSGFSPYRDVLEVAIFQSCLLVLFLGLLVVMMLAYGVDGGGGWIVGAIALFLSVASIVALYDMFRASSVSAMLADTIAKWLVLKDDPGSHVPYRRVGRHQMAHEFHDPRVDGPSRGYVETWTEYHLLLASLRRSPIHHVFVVSDLLSSKPVHFDQDGCRILGKDSVVEVDMTLAEAVTASMMFPGYVVSQHLPLAVDGQMLELVDGGLYDNLALSVYADVDPRITTILSVDARVVKSAAGAWPRRFTRIRLLARAVSDLHRRTSEAYLPLSTRWGGNFVRLQLPASEFMKTTLAPTPGVRIARLREAGRQTARNCLGSAR